MAEADRCPNCGGELLANAPHGLCPACLLVHGLDSSAAGSGPVDGTKIPKSPFPRSIANRVDGGTLLAILDRLEQFEAAWQRGEPIMLETLLSESIGEGREELIRQALAIELDYRRRRGESPAPEEYLRRLPDHAGAVQGAFEEATVTYTAKSSFNSSEGAVPKTLGKFQVIGRLGTGGQGAALLARDSDLGRLVVLKCYRGSADTADHSEVLRDGQALSRLRSPYIPSCHGVERIGDDLILVMEYVPGRNLAESIKSGRISPGAAAKLVEQVAEGLEAVHACGLIHRDIKPANIVLGQDHLPRLVDFGLAAHLGSQALHGISGTPQYMAPEQARGQWEQIDGRTDIFGLGAVLYALLTGKPPHPGKSVDESLKHAREGVVTPPRALNRSVPRDLERIVLKALEADPTRRYATATELRQALRHRRLRRRYWPMGAAAALLLASVVVSYVVRSISTQTDGTTSLIAQAQQLIKVDRAGREVSLQDAVPLVSGDKLWIECELPSGWRASAFWLDSEGKISELSPLAIKRRGLRDRLSYPPPDAANNAVTLEGPPGTEMVVVCARPGTRIDRREVEALIPRTAAQAALRARSVLLIGNGRTDLLISGAPHSPAGAGFDDSRALGRFQPSDARDAEERFRQIAEGLARRFEFVAGAAFHHQESWHK